MFEYVIVAVGVVAILIVVCIVLNNKYVNETNEAKSKVSQDVLKRLKLAKIVENPNNHKQYTTEGVITDVKIADNTTKVNVLYFSNFVGEYVVTRNVVCKKAVKVGDLVTTVHKKNKDFGMSKVKGIM